MKCKEENNAHLHPLSLKLNLDSNQQHLQRKKLIGKKWKIYYTNQKEFNKYNENVVQVRRILGTLIKSIKGALHQVIFRSSVNYEKLLTIIESKGIMNSLPLTYINDDIAVVLTPGHLMGKE